MTDTITLPRSVVEQALEALNATMATHGKREWIEAAKQQADATLRSALEQSQGEQKPVAWLHADGKHQPLYTHPQPKREPLTNEQILDVAESIGIQFSIERLDAQIDDILVFARAIERAHGIGGEK